MGKWDGFPLYDRPLGAVTEGTDDGRPVVLISDFSRCEPADLAAWAAADLPLPPKLRFTRYGGSTPDRYPAGTGG